MPRAVIHRARAMASSYYRIVADNQRRWRRLLFWALALGPMLWGAVVEPRRLVVTTAEVNAARPEATRIAVFADVHFGSLHVGAARLEGIVDALLAQKPDLILFLGDLVATRSLLADPPDAEAAAAPLSRLKAPLGVYAVLGNHEHWFDAPLVTRALTKAGVTVLDNAAVHIADDLWLVGIGDAFTRHDDVAHAFARVPGDAFVIIATHSPDVFPELPDRPSLTFAGHTHGGQVALPFYGPLVVPSRFGTRYARGAFTAGKRRMHVTSGIGTSILPIRFGVPPEILVVTLR